MKKLIIILILAIACPGWPATVYVKDTGSGVYYESGAANCDAVTTGDTAGDLEAALTAAGASGTLYICAGTYTQTEIDADSKLDVGAASQSILGATSDASDVIISSAATDDTGSGWSLVSGEYEKTYTTEPQIVVGDDTRLVEGTAGSLAAGEWDWSANTLYLKNNPTSYTTLEVGQVTPTIEVSGNNSTTIKYITVRVDNGNPGQVQQGAIHLEGSDSSEVSYCTLTLNGVSGLTVIGADPGTFTHNTASYNWIGLNFYTYALGASANVTISNNTLHDNRSTGINTQSSAYANRHTSFTISSNTAYGNSSGIYVRNLTSSTVSNNNLYDNTLTDGETYGIGAQSVSTTYEFNRFYQNGDGATSDYNMQLYSDGSIDGDGNVIRFNYFEGRGDDSGDKGFAISSGVANSGDNTLIYGNVFVENHHNFLIDINGADTGCKLFNNTFIGGQNSIWFQDDNCDNWIISNNLMYDFGNNGLSIGSCTTEPTHNTNLYYVSGGGDYAVYNSTTYTQANITSFEASAISSDPSLNSDYTLSSSSPAINAGTDLGTYNAVDPRSGNWPDNIMLRSQDSRGSGWEIGSFIYIDPTVGGGVSIGGAP